MVGETNLQKLISSMEPSLAAQPYVFCSVSKFNSVDFNEIRPIGTFLEKEGMTLIVDKETADERGMQYESTFSCITLNVHSSLDAVGLTAAIATALAKVNISANVVAAYYHDHVFVPFEVREKALETLLALTKQ